MQLNPDCGKSIKPSNSNEFNIQPWINLVKKDILDSIKNDISEFVTSEIERYEKEITIILRQNLKEINENTTI